jgi:hypothetical protein
MSEAARLGAAIKTISEKYLGNVIAANDTAGIAKWSIRLADYATRLAVLVSPPLPPIEHKDVVIPEPLSSDAATALAQLLKAAGHPLTFITDENGVKWSVSIDPAAVAQDATPEQQREIALLGFFGVGPDHLAGVDYTLRDRYYTNQGRAPIDPDIDPWATYLASKA